MVGGLIQLVSYGSQDLYLTGTPQITFFKMVYRRYTNFSQESVKINFDDAGFDKECIFTIPKIGDLMYKIYLEISLPEIKLLKSNFETKANFRCLEQELQILCKKYETILKFIELSRAALIEANEIYEAENNFDVNKMVKIIIEIFEDPGKLDIIKEFHDIVEENDWLFMFEEICLKTVVLNNTTEDKNVLFKDICATFNKLVKFQNKYYQLMTTKKQEFEEKNNRAIKFAWIKKIGLFLMEYVELRIGGQTIDKYWSDWMNIWHELSGKESLDTAYNKLIGLVDELTCFNSMRKPAYKLRIPLIFWFCQLSGLALPLISLEYHDVTLHIKFRPMAEVSYIEKDSLILNLNGDEGLYLDEITEIMGIDFKANVLIDYFFLDGLERKKFAQSSHEYLIDQVQVMEFNDIVTKEVQLNLDNFVHPCREMVWVAQRQSFIDNPEGFNRLRWGEYGICQHNKGNPCKFSAIFFHGYHRTPKLDGNYFNFVQPYQCHSSSPSYGINLYSFALYPEEFQPSGSANFSKLKKIVLSIEFDKKLICNNQLLEPMSVKVFVKNMNILRFVGGMAGLAWT